MFEGMLVVPSLLSDWVRRVKRETDIAFVVLLKTSVSCDITSERRD